MIGFFIKKTFYDGWDTLVHILVCNFVLTSVALGGLYLSASLLPALLPALLVFFSTATIIGFFLGGISARMARVAGNEHFEFKELPLALRQDGPVGALFGLAVAVAIILFVVAFRFYTSDNSGFSFIAVIPLFWMALAGLLSLQWFFPLRSQLNDGFLKTLRKCFLIFLDNPGFSIFMLLYGLVITALSVVLVFLLPGISGMILAWNEALRLRLYKYDWMKAHPEISTITARKQIPWDYLLAEDREITGHRSIKSFIFPWKD